MMVEVVDRSLFGRESEGADINGEQIESLVLNLADVGLGGGILEDLDEQIVLRQEVCDISLL